MEKTEEEQIKPEKKMSGREVKEYLSNHHINRLLETLVTGLLYHRPDDPISFLLSCLIATRRLGGPERITWDTFIHLEQGQLDLGPLRTKHNIELQTQPSITPPTWPPVLPAIPTITPTIPTQAPPPLLPHTPQVPPVKIKTPILPPLKPLLPSSSSHETPSELLKLAPSPPPPGPVGAPGVHAEVIQETKHPSRDAPPAVHSQLSIDSDSGMTESSGLLQEVSIHPSERPRPVIIFIIGGPRSGKGSQTARLTHHFGLRGISLDELVRRQLQSNAPPRKKWELISQVMSHGELEPQEDTISELRQQLIGQQEVQGFVVDGFPRDIHQALSFQEQIGSPDLVMLLHCSNEMLCCRLQRQATRLGLLGDSSHALGRRLNKFERDIVSISRYYRQLHLLVQVDADQVEEAVFADLSSAIRERQLLKDPPDAAGIPE